MMELQLVLDFACCSCNHALSVTLKCSGKGLAAGGRSVAAVKVPCPTCNGMNELYFEPNGRIHAVTPCREFCRVPEPSVN